jgi:hypothetical protein
VESGFAILIDVDGIRQEEKHARNIYMLPRRMGKPNKGQEFRHKAHMGQWTPVPAHFGID